MLSALSQLLNKVSCGSDFNNILTLVEKLGSKNLANAVPGETGVNVCVEISPSPYLSYQLISKRTHFPSECN
jgi:hypothetical protein